MKMNKILNLLIGFILITQSAPAGAMYKSATWVPYDGNPGDTSGQRHGGHWKPDLGPTPRGGSSTTTQSTTPPLTMENWGKFWNGGRNPVPTTVRSAPHSTVSAKPQPNQNAEKKAAEKAATEKAVLERVAAETAALDQAMNQSLKSVTDRAFNRIQNRFSLFREISEPRITIGFM